MQNLNIMGTKGSEFLINGAEIDELRINGTTVWTRQENIYDRTIEVTTWAELRNAVLGTLANERIQIIVMNDMATDLPAGVLTVAVDRDITITSSGNNTFILKRYTLAQRHFTLNGTLRLRNIELQGDYPNNTANHGGISVNADGHLFMEEGSAVTKNRNNGATLSGGVSVIGGRFTMNGGEIVGNSSFTETRYDSSLPVPANAGMSGGVSARNGATVVINNGVISDNEGRFGGGLIINSTADFAVGDTYVTINGGVFNNNDGSFGGFANVEFGTLEINAGTFFGNRATAFANAPATTINAGRGGGALFVQNGGHVIIGGGTFEGNTSGNDGGAIMLTAATRIDMEGGTITQNEAARDGGGVARISTGVFNRTGGAIEENTAGRNGNDVFPV